MLFWHSTLPLKTEGNFLDQGPVVWSIRKTSQLGGWKIPLRHSYYLVWLHYCNPSRHSIHSKRCNIEKLKRNRDEDIMLLSNKLQSLWLPTRSHEADSGSPSVEDSHSVTQFVPRARKIKTLGCLLLLRALKENFTIKFANVKLCQARCYPVKRIVLQVKELQFRGWQRASQTDRHRMLSLPCLQVCIDLCYPPIYSAFWKCRRLFFTNYETLCYPLSL